MPNSHQLFNRLPHKSRRQALRANLTEPEHRLCQALRGRQLGVTLRRQHGIGPDVAGVYCTERSMAIELDGYSHCNTEAMAYNQERDLFMTSNNLQVIRFTISQIMQELQELLAV